MRPGWDSALPRGFRSVRDRMGVRPVVKRETEVADNEQMLQLAARALQAGNKEGARMMFRQVYERDNRNERALYGLARVAKTPAERTQYLKRLLKVNPQHEGARTLMKKLRYKRAANENRTLLIGGAAVVTLIVLVVAIVLLVLSMPR